MDRPIDTDFARLDAVPGGARCVQEVGTVSNHDDALAERCAKGDDEAFRQLVERYQIRLYRFCCQWLPDAEDAREAVQDTFVQVFGAIARYRRRGKFSAWIYRIALNQCRDRHRSRAGKQRQVTGALPEEGGGPEFRCSRPTPDEVAVRSCEWEKLQRGIALLPRKLREVVVLRGVEGFGEEASAEILGISKRAVEGRYYRARLELAEWFERTAAAEGRLSAISRGNPASVSFPL